MRIRLFAQMLNSGVRFPSPVFAPDDELGGGDEQQQEEQQQEEKPKPSRFDVGLGKLRTQEEEQEEQDGKDPKEVKPGERPAYVQEKFWDAKTGQIRHEAMAKAYGDLETKLRNGGKVDPNDTVPETATVADYFGEEIALDESVDRIGVTMDDPGLKVAADVFHKYGIGKATALNIVKDMFKGMNEHAPAPMDPDAELKSLGPNGKAVIDGTYAWLNKIDAEGQLNDDDAETAISLMGTARGVKFLNKIRGMTGEQAIPMGQHIPASGGMSPQEWHQAYGAAIKAGDEKEQERLDNMSAGVFGNAPASGSPIRGIPGR